MTAWSRVTLVGPERRVDAVLPAREPIGELMPEMLRLLGDTASGPARLLHLTTASGSILTGDTTLAERDVTDGAVLRLVRSDEPLPAPVVHEVPEAVDEALNGHPGHWSPQAARWTATGAVGALCLALGALVWNGTHDGAGAAVMAVLAAVLLAVGLVLGVVGREPLGTALALGGGAIGVLAVWFTADLYAWPGWLRWGGLAMLPGLIVLGLGVTSPLGRGGVVGGTVALALALVWLGCGLAGLSIADTGVVLALACVVLLSLFLRVALTLSGLTVLDDRRSAAGTVARTDVASALANAHRSVTVATAATAIAAAVAGWGLATEFTWWTASLAVLLAVVVASRSRMFPLVAEKAALLAAAVVIVASFALAWSGQAPWAGWPAAGLLLVTLVLPVTVLSVQAPEHIRARLRRITSRIEAVAVVLLVPVAVGALGTFERLLATF
ncbi:type VII secretion integral membrane protein EccD [Salinactinospora qingdaonensis]|uniref:EccD-like transmembrane domain-containing protein n=1 Tax=Salinactinospora qingdaonensis TaxID=702744 RepID=A0ABP7GA33_9ACTN